MKTMTKLLWAAAAAVSLCSTGALAQYVGPGGFRPAPPPPGVHHPPHNYAVSSAQHVLSRGRNDQWVTLEGHIVRQIRHEHYVFRDRSGEMVVEIDDDLMRGHRIDDRTRVRLSGEIDAKFGRPNEIEVKRLEIR